jgi:hypothetical protein
MAAALIARVIGLYFIDEKFAIARLFCRGMHERFVVLAHAYKLNTF